MDNHYHLLVETPRANLHQIMQNINTSYTVFVNRKYNRSGHLFQRRYKPLIVDKDRYLLALSRYIHRNPVRAGAVERAEEFRWSSYQEYLYGRKDGALTDTDVTLSFFSKQRAVAVRKYKEFVEAGGIQVETPLQDVAGSVLGDESFRERVLKLLKITSGRAGIPEIKKIERKHEIKDIVRGVAGYYGLTEEDLIKRRKRTEGERRIGVYLSKVLSGKRNGDIGDVFGITIQAVTNAVRGVEERREEDRRFNSELKRIKEAVGGLKQNV